MTHSNPLLILSEFLTLFITVSVTFIWQSLDKHGGIIPGGILISPGGMVMKYIPARASACFITLLYMKGAEGS